ncbi:MAG: hypothetical protein K2L06_00790, partial [Alistipes sp.]|nr:hypothetical protein [Alistipes sp.]
KAAPSHCKPTTKQQNSFFQNPLLKQAVSGLLNLPYLSDASLSLHHSGPNEVAEAKISNFRKNLWDVPAVPSKRLQTGDSGPLRPEIPRRRFFP